MKTPRKGPTNDDALRWIDKMFPVECPYFTTSESPVSDGKICMFCSADLLDDPIEHEYYCPYPQARELLEGKAVPSEEGALALRENVKRLKAENAELKRKIRTRECIYCGARPNVDFHSEDCPANDKAILNDDGV